jgi:hypothetical protein
MPWHSGSESTTWTVLHGVGGGWGACVGRGLTLALTRACSPTATCDPSPFFAHMATHAHTTRDGCRQVRRLTGSAAAQGHRPRTTTTKPAVPTASAAGRQERKQPMLASQPAPSGPYHYLCHPRQRRPRWRAAEIPTAPCRRQQTLTGQPGRVAGTARGATAAHLRWQLLRAARPRADADEACRASTNVA